MKRLDKPTRCWCDYLINIEKKSVVHFKLLLNSNLSEYLQGNSLFFWLRVFNFTKTILLENFPFHNHQVTANKTTVKGDNTEGG